MGILVSHISKSYKEVQALHDVSFEVKEGELFGLIGPDGAGKTTLFRILTTLLLADNGNAVVAGNDVVHNYREIRNQVGYMPGRFSLYQDLTVEENLHFFATIFGTTVAENYELIKDIYDQISPFKNRRAGKLSGGMKQKLALSCALIHKPQVLFLDEPTTGVDPVSRKEFWEMLKRLQKRGITILVSTPYMDEAELCDWVALIHQGKILKIGTPYTITNHFPRFIYSISANEMYLMIQHLKQYSFVHTVYPFGSSLHYVDKRETDVKTEIHAYLVGCGISDVKVSSIQPTIEDVFMELAR